LSFVCAFRAKGGDDFPVDVEDLDAVVVGVGDDDAVGVADGHVVRMFKISWSRTRLAEFAHERTIGLENLGKIFLKIIICYFKCSCIKVTNNKLSPNIN